jgi:hypothetical protein
MFIGLLSLPLWFFERRIGGAEGGSDSIAELSTSPEVVHRYAIVCRGASRST